MELVKLVRRTRGQASRVIEFFGIQTEKPTGEFTKPRKAEDTPEPIMEDVTLEELPAADDILSKLYEVLENSEHKIRLTLAKTLNAVLFAAEVAKTATVVEDTLSPVFAEAGITDESLITTYRRNVSMAYGIYVKTGKIKDADSLTPEQVAEKKVKILRKMLAEVEF
jgi:hypothetical protein